MIKMVGRLSRTPYLIGCTSTRVYVCKTADNWMYLRSYLGFSYVHTDSCIVSMMLQSVRWWIFRIGIPHTTWRVHILGSRSNQSI